MRFLTEDPWERLAEIRERVPNILLQMLLRGSNAVGYANYPDNVVRFFVGQAAAAGIDLFRVFDCLNWVENMRVSMDAVREAGKLCEGAFCYTGDILDPDRAKYSLKYYVGLTKELEAAGAHIIGIKDMAGLLKPAAAKKLVSTLREETGLPIHFHTHDTSGISAASVLAAVEAGVDAVDAAVDSLSNLTSQPTLGSIVEALKGPSAIPASMPPPSARSRSISRRCAPSIVPSSPTSASAPPRSISTRCRAGSSPTSKSRPVPSGWKIAGTRWRRPMPT
jgi:pyruvate carboxylase